MRRSELVKALAEINQSLDVAERLADDLWSR